jgi:N-methylhydantoinase A/oxoprolinase/acetone carboxylase beta subunit
MRRLGVDVGGTFTDLIYVDDESGQVVVHKLPTTPDDPSRGTVQGIRELTGEAGASPEVLDQVFHGTTIATNIVIEHTGARVGMITTEGYRDILHIARHKKPLNFSNYQDLPWQRYPIVRRRYRLTVPERITAEGSVLVPLDEERAREQVRRLRADGVEAVAVCFLFSFLNQEHEARVAEIVREEFPEAFLSVSSEVLPQYREYERFSTVCLNAYIGPKVGSYVRRLEEELQGLGVRTGLHLMTSASGVATPEAAARRPVNLLMSGPVAGVVGGIWAGKHAGHDNVITLDVGGTSADIGLAQSGKLRMKHLLDTRVGPYQAMIPMVDVDTIGAGGGSIAYVDQGGIFRVGPRSAGADPGPAAYGRGGTDATATDAMVVLGWLLPEAFLGGGMHLDADLARRAFAEGPASALGMSVEEAAMGAVQILTHSMVQAIEENSVRKGFDPRDFALVAAGGAGPIFAAQIAVEVGTPSVVVPPYPGVTAAMGLLATDMVYEYAATTYQRLSSLDARTLEERFAELEAEARERLQSDGIPADRVEIHRVVDARYAGQGYELRVDVGEGPIDGAWIDRLRADFHAIHEREYSRRFENADIELPNVRVRGVGLMPPLVTAEVERGDESADAALRHEGPAWFRVDGALVTLTTRYYDRAALEAGNKLEGPAIVYQYDSTTVVPPGLEASVDRYGNIVIAASAGELEAAEAGTGGMARVASAFASGSRKELA